MNSIVVTHQIFLFALVLAGLGQAMELDGALSQDSFNWRELPVLTKHTIIQSMDPVSRSRFMVTDRQNKKDGHTIRAGIHALLRDHSDLSERITSFCKASEANSDFLEEHRYLGKELKMVLSRFSREMELPGSIKRLQKDSAHFQTIQKELTFLESLLVAYTRCKCSFDIYEPLLNFSKVVKLILMKIGSSERLDELLTNGMDDFFNDPEYSTILMEESDEIQSSHVLYICSNFEDLNDIIVRIATTKSISSGLQNKRSLNPQDWQFISLALQSSAIDDLRMIHVNSASDVLISPEIMKKRAKKFQKFFEKISKQPLPGNLIDYPHLIIAAAKAREEPVYGQKAKIGARRIVETSSFSSLKQVRSFFAAPILAIANFAFVPSYTRWFQQIKTLALQCVRQSCDLAKEMGEPALRFFFGITDFDQHNELLEEIVHNMTPYNARLISLEAYN